MLDTIEHGACNDSTYIYIYQVYIGTNFPAVPILSCFPRYHRAPMYSLGYSRDPWNTHSGHTSALQSAHKIDLVKPYLLFAKDSALRRSIHPRVRLCRDCTWNVLVTVRFAMSTPTTVQLLPEHKRPVLFYVQQHSVQFR